MSNAACRDKWFDDLDKGDGFPKEKKMTGQDMSVFGDGFVNHARLQQGHCRASHES